MRMLLRVVLAAGLALGVATVAGAQTATPTPTSTPTLTFTPTNNADRPGTSVDFLELREYGGFVPAPGTTWVPDRCRLMVSAISGTPKVYLICGTGTPAPLH